MKAEITISSIYWNKGLGNFFFREQAYNTLEELVHSSTTDGALTLGDLDDATEEMNINEVEEMFNSYDVRTLADSFGLDIDE